MLWRSENFALDVMGYITVHVCVCAPHTIVYTLLIQAWKKKTSSSPKGS